MRNMSQVWSQIKLCFRVVGLSHALWLVLVSCLAWPLLCVQTGEARGKWKKLVECFTKLMKSGFKTISNLWQMTVWYLGVFKGKVSGEE